MNFHQLTSPKTPANTGVVFIFKHPNDKLKTTHTDLLQNSLHLDVIHWDGTQLNTFMLFSLLVWDDGVVSAVRTMKEAFAICFKTWFQKING